MPPHKQLRHVAVMGRSVSLLHNISISSLLMRTIQHYLLEQDSPVPRKIVAKVQSEELVDMTDLLLPDWLKSGQAPEDSPKHF